MKQLTNFFWSACICLVFSLFGGAQRAEAQTVKELKYYDVKELVQKGEAFIIGKAKTSKEEAIATDSCFYYRLPGRLQGVVREEVWTLGKDAAGVAVRFSSDALAIGVRWTLTYNFNMAHMAATGIRGLDLYTLDKGWKFAGTAFPNGKNSNSMIISKMGGDKREYLLYLPLYDGIESLEIGINSTAKIYAPQGLLMPSGEPIVFYGTSVTQGGCASRPGMAYPSIISRALSKEVINLGFSGNGRMDKSMADFIAEIPAAAYVIDCLANCTYEMTRDSSAYFIARIASAHPHVPVYMVSNYHNPKQFLLSESKTALEKENALWKAIYKRLYNEGSTLGGHSTGPLKNLRYLDVFSDSIVGDEDTVDGTHLTDKGFANFATFLLRSIK